MNIRHSINRRNASRNVGAPRQQSAFTLVELLVVISIIGILITILGATVTTSLRKAREAATTALIHKIDGLLDERLKGFDRATKSRDFDRIVQQTAQGLEAAGIFGVRKSVIASIARKNYFRAYFPQRFEDLADINANGIPDLFESDAVLKPEDTNQDGQLNGTEDSNGNGKLDGFVLFNHLSAASQNGSRLTESSELLYFMLTKMEAFGVPPVSESEFSTSELRDMDGDGLMEFVDGWGRPLRFYRWPTRLLKPNGVFGPDNKPGAAGSDDDGNGLTDDPWEIGWPGSDDYRALNPINNAIPAVASDPNTPYHLPRRDLAGLLISGLPPKPATYNSGGSQLRYRYDTLDEDPDDPYGLIVLDMRRLARPTGAVAAFNVFAITAASPHGGYPEGLYPTLDTYHTPLVVSAGADGLLGLHEPYVLADSDGDGYYDPPFGVLAQPIYTGTNPNDIPSSTFAALTDNLTNRNRRAGEGR